MFDESNEINMNLFNESAIQDPSTTWQYRDGKLNDSYFSRASNNTMEWIRKQSLLERFFCVTCLFVFICLFILIYISFHHVNMDPLKASLIQNETDERNAFNESTKLKPSSCSLIGLNHLVALRPLFNSTNDYYWFKTGPKLPKDYYKRNITLDLKDPYDFEDLVKDWSKRCEAKKESFWCKIKSFWNSCLKRDNLKESKNSFKNLLTKLGFIQNGNQTKCILNSTRNEKQIGDLLYQLDKNGQSNGLYFYKPLNDKTINDGIFIIGKDNYPHYLKRPNPKASLSDDSGSIGKKLQKLCDLDVTETEEILAFDENLTKFKGFSNLSCSCGVNCSQYAYYKLNSYRNQFEKLHKPGYVIEYPDGYIKYLQTQKYNLNLYFLWTTYKTNLIHTASGLKIFSEYFESTNADNLNMFCRDMLKLPFGLVLLNQMIQLNSNYTLNNEEISSIIANEIFDSFDTSWIGEYKLNHNSKFTRLIGKLFTSIESLVTNEKIQFINEYLESVYNQLQIGENYFENVQSIRLWLRKGYQEGCILNLASI